MDRTKNVKSNDRDATPSVYVFAKREISYTNTGNIVIRYWNSPELVCMHCGLPIEQLKTYTGEMKYYHKDKPIEHGTITSNVYCKMMTDDPLPAGEPMSSLAVAEPGDVQTRVRTIIFDEQESDDLINFIQCDINERA